MKFLLSVLLVGSSLSTAALAASVGTLDNVQGVVSMSSNGVVKSVVGSTELVNGSVVLNSATGTSVVKLGNGCTVALKPNQVLTVNSAVSCADLISSVKTLATPVVAADGSEISPLLIGAGVVVGGALIYNATKTKASGS